MDASTGRPSFLQRSRYTLTSSEAIGDEEEASAEDQLAAQEFPPQVRTELSRQLLRLLSTSPSTSTAAPELESPSTLLAAPAPESLTRLSSATSSTSSTDDEECDGDPSVQVNSKGRLRRYHKRPSISINSENALQHQEILVSASPITPVSPIVTAALAASPPQPPWERWQGFVMLATSAFCFSLMSLFVSLTGSRVNSFLLVWWRCLVQFTLAILIMLVQRASLEEILGEKGKRKWIFARGAVGICSLSCFYYSLTTLPLSDATVLFFTAPIYASILGRFVLGESFDRYDALTSAASFVGVVFVARPAVFFGSNSSDQVIDSSTAQRSLSVFIALLGAFISSWVYVFIRKVGKGSKPLVLVHYLGFMGLVFAPLDALFEVWSMPGGVDLLYMAFLGLFAFAGQFLFNAGVQKEKAGVSALIRNLDIVFSFVWQLSVEGVAVNGWSFLGACIVTGSVVGLGVRKWRREKRMAPQATQPVAELKVLDVDGEAQEVEPTLKAGAAVEMQPAAQDKEQVK